MAYQVRYADRAKAARSKLPFKAKAALKGIEILLKANPYTVGRQDGPDEKRRVVDFAGCGMAFCIITGEPAVVIVDIVWGG